jgi:hypothetical protein
MGKMGKPWEHIGTYEETHGLLCFFLNLIVFFCGKPDVCEREHGSIAEPFRLNSA